jgi:outer membrane protein assembly factor BamB
MKQTECTPRNGKSPVASITALKILTLLALLTLAASANADLLVLRDGGNDPALVRFDDSGQQIGGFGLSAESMEGIAASQSEIYIACNTLGSGEIVRLNAAGELVGSFTPANLTLPGTIRVGPDGYLYAIAGTFGGAGITSHVLKYDPQTGGFLDCVALSGDAGGSLFTDLAFSPNRQLYVADFDKGVLRYNTKTGRFMGVVAPVGPRGFNSPTALAFGPDGNLYVASRDQNAVYRFDGRTGRSLGIFVPSASGGLSAPMGLAFGPDGNLYVTSFNTASVLRYDGRTGQFIDAFVDSNPNLQNPTRLMFTPSEAIRLAAVRRR